MTLRMLYRKASPVELHLTFAGLPFWHSGRERATASRWSRREIWTWSVHSRGESERIASGPIHSEQQARAELMDAVTEVAYVTSHRLRHRTLVPFPDMYSARACSFDVISLDPPPDELGIMDTSIVMGKVGVIMRAGMLAIPLARFFRFDDADTFATAMRQIHERWPHEPGHLTDSWPLDRTHLPVDEPSMLPADTVGMIHTAATDRDPEDMLRAADEASLDRLTDKAYPYALGLLNGRIDSPHSWKNLEHDPLYPSAVAGYRLGRVLLGTHESPIRYTGDSMEHVRVEGHLMTQEILDALCGGAEPFFDRLSGPQTALGLAIRMSAMKGFQWVPDNESVDTETIGRLHVAAVFGLATAAVEHDRHFYRPAISRR